MEMKVLYLAGEGTKISESEAVTIDTNSLIPDADGNKITKLEDTLPQPVSSDVTEKAEPEICNITRPNTSKNIPHTNPLSVSPIIINT